MQTNRRDCSDIAAFANQHRAPWITIWFMAHPFTEKRLVMLGNAR
jgi:hypothetical protein